MKEISNNKKHSHLWGSEYIPYEGDRYLYSEEELQKSIIEAETATYAVAVTVFEYCPNCGEQLVK